MFCLRQLHSEQAAPFSLSLPETIVHSESWSWKQLHPKDAKELVEFIQPSHLDSVDPEWGRGF